MGYSGVGAIARCAKTGRGKPANSKGPQLTESAESLRARALAEFGQELHELERALDEMVDESIGEWLEGTSIEIGDETESDQPIDPDATRVVAERVLASSAAAILLDRICDPEDEWEADLRGKAYALRKRACLDLLVFTARSGEAW